MKDLEFNFKKIQHIEELLNSLPVQIEKDIHNFLVTLKKETYIKFIKSSKGLGYSIKEIAKFLGKSYEFVHRLDRYGLSGLITPSIRGKILARDSKKCQLCGVVGKLHIHHISDPTSRKQNNLIALCAACHKAEHKIIDEKIKVSN